MKKILYKIWNYSPAQIVGILRNKLYPPKQIIDFKIDSLELTRLQNMPRYQETDTLLLGKKIHIIDASSYLSMLNELFVRQNYKFIAGRSDPLIIDCGSNIGLSVIYFKMLYPFAKIIAFEPDPKAFAALTYNIKSFGFSDVELHNKAVWISDSKINFFREGSWGGKIVAETNGDNIISVEATSLKKYLSEKTDFLKIDIEGAETEVINECREELKNVKNLFVEYHSSTGKVQVLSNLLASLSGAGFRYHVKEASVRKQPFIEKTREGFDSQLDIFAFKD